jgi:predicted O-methyltransferase YrrM
MSAGATTHTADDLTEADDVTEFVTRLYQAMLGRPPRPSELTLAKRLCEAGSERRLVLKLLDSNKHKSLVGVPTPFVNGHFYSPVVDPTEAEPYWRASVAQRWNELPDIYLDLERMERFWAKHLKVARSAPFTEHAGGKTRYYWSEGPYPRGDAIVLLVMLGAARPKRIIEIGSGYSSAAMLDAADHFPLREFSLTCIDPNTARLRKVLRPEDHQRIEIIEQFVQDVPVERFQALNKNDILFIDSSHVLKTGSDLHYELFSILPNLKKGVLVHFHDIFSPFEYPKEWVFGKRRSWNEVYALRAFLSFNSAFEVVFFTNLFAHERAEQFRSGFPDVSRVAGGSIWLRRRTAPR